MGVGESKSLAEPTSEQVAKASRNSVAVVGGSTHSCIRAQNFPAHGTGRHAAAKLSGTKAGATIRWLGDLHALSGIPRPGGRSHGPLRVGIAEPHSSRGGCSHRLS